MATYETEEEQIEAIKKWWKDNGQSVVVGIALGFTLLFGWHTWRNYQESQAEQASYTYEEVFSLAQQNQPDKMTAVAQKLLADHPNSTYAVLTAFLQAQQNVKADQLEAAKANLQWVIDNADLPELKSLAYLRKARLLMDAKALEAAQQALDEVHIKAYEGLKNELQGDIYLAQNSPKDALAAYAKALQDESLSAQQRSWLEMKWDNLGGDAQAVSAPNVLPPEWLLIPSDVLANAATAGLQAQEAMATPVTINLSSPTLDVVQ